MSGVIDPFEGSEMVRIQEDLYYGLRSWWALADVNVVQMRKLTMQAEVDASAIYATPRSLPDGQPGGRSGVGILVEMPTVIVEHPAGPLQEQLAVTCAVIEEPNLNMNPDSGTRLDAESVGRLIRRFMHGWFLRNQGEFYSQKTAMVPTEDWPGLVAYRIGSAIQLAEDVWPRVTAPAIAQSGADGFMLSPASGEEAAAIYYTLDRSYPGSGNPAAVRYAGGTVWVTSGVETRVRWGAELSGCMNSAVEEAVVDEEGVVHHPMLGT